MEILFKTSKTEIDIIKKFFVDPNDPESAEDLAQLGRDTIRALAQIYSTGGQIDQMDPATKHWLENPHKNSPSALSAQIGEVLRRETQTRRFDSKFMGQIHPQGSKIGILANLIGAYMNTNRIYRGVSIAEAEMEENSIKWLGSIFGYDTEVSGGNITTGGTTANIEALWVAREKILSQMKTNNRKNDTPLYILSSRWRHYSIDKAATMLGMRLVTVPDNGMFKVDTKILEARAKAISAGGGRIAVIVGIAGETETGMIEDLQGLANIARKFDSFYHIDAAYGGPFVLSKTGYLFSGINQADSITVDPHKMLYTPYSAGAVLFKNSGDHLLISKVHNQGYLRNVVARVEGSMGSGGVIATWATKEMLGNEGIAALLNHNLEMADYCYHKTNSSNLIKPLYKPELNTVLIGIRPEISKVRNNALMKEIEKLTEQVSPGAIYISRNENILHGKDALRFVSMHPYTTTDDIDEMAEFLEGFIGKRI